MKKSILSLMVSFGIWSCEKQNQNMISSESSVDTSQNLTTESVNIDPVNYLHYNQKFIDGLSEYNEPIKIIENYLLVGQDTVYFPEELPLNKKTSFKGTKNSNDFVLNLTRTNLTNLIYDFEVVDKNSEKINSKSGVAILGSHFFVASEADEDDVTGDGYLSVEYEDNSDDCTFSLRIGEEDENGKLRAKIILFCKEGDLKNINLEDSPTLRIE